MSQNVGQVFDFDPLLVAYTEEQRCRLTLATSRLPRADACMPRDGGGTCHTVILQYPRIQPDAERLARSPPVVRRHSAGDIVWYGGGGTGSPQDGRPDGTTLPRQ